MMPSLVSKPKLFSDSVTENCHIPLTTRWYLQKLPWVNYPLPVADRRVNTAAILESIMSIMAAILKFKIAATGGGGFQSLVLIDKWSYKCAKFHNFAIMWNILPYFVTRWTDTPLTGDRPL